MVAEFGNQSISLTETSKKRLQSLIEIGGTGMIKLSLNSRGCNGHSYQLDYVGEAGRFDEIVDLNPGKLVIDAKSILFLLGTQIDWQEDKFGSRFVYSSPKATSMCGCGASVAF
jgi:iron-sulfur cluster assembly protein